MTGTKYGELYKRRMESYCKDHGFTVPGRLSRRYWINRYILVCKQGFEPRVIDGSWWERGEIIRHFKHLDRQNELFGDYLNVAVDLKDGFELRISNSASLRRDRA